jgi:hypothetical protein
MCDAAKEEEKPAEKPPAPQNKSRIFRMESPLGFVYYILNSWCGHEFFVMLGMKSY